MKRLLVPVLLLLHFTGFAQSAPPTAAEVLQSATDRAARENKKVFLIFHASWCGWCHKMDTAMNDRSVRRFFDDNFVVTHLTVLESDKRKKDENEGALAMLEQYGGKDQGIPYWLIFDKDGQLLADSKRRPEGAGPTAPGENTGCPATREEVAYFISVLKKTTPLNSSQLAAIEKRFRENEQ